MILAKFRLWWLCRGWSLSSFVHMSSSCSFSFFPSEVSLLPEAEGQMTPCDSNIQQALESSCWKEWWLLSFLSCRCSWSPPWLAALSELPLELPSLAEPRCCQGECASLHPCKAWPYFPPKQRADGPLPLTHFSVHCFVFCAWRQKKKMVNLLYFWSHPFSWDNDLQNPQDTFPNTRAALREQNKVLGVFRFQSPTFWPYSNVCSYNMCLFGFLFSAPEVLAQKPYSKAVDCWSIGVIAYILWVPLEFPVLAPLGPAVPPWSHLLSLGQNNESLTFVTQGSMYPGHLLVA